MTRPSQGTGREVCSVALIGSRGIPASYGGYETLMEELAPRLVERGFDVTVYCRSHHTPRELESYRGVRLVVLPTLRGKYLDTSIHTLLACLHAARTGFDAALVVNSVNVAFVPLLRLRGIPTALHVDGVERRRGKWGWPGRALYAAAERLATRLPDRMITDAESIRAYYRERYGHDSDMIAYGVDPRPVPPGDTLRELGLQPRRYYLYVSRFEPENNPHRVVQAYASVSGEWPLVMVGGAPYANRFIRGFTARADSRVLFPGTVYGEGYRELLSHALAYIQATEVGGSHPALIEAMGYGNCILANDNPENREVAGEAAIYFRAGEPTTLVRAFERVSRDPGAATRLGEVAAGRARQRYSWDQVTDLYADLFRRLARQREGGYVSDAG